MASNSLHKLAHSSDAERVRHKPSKPWESILSPHIEAIAEMRSGRHPIPYRKISIELEEKYGLHVAFSTIASFVRARAKERKSKSVHQSYLAKPAAPASSGAEALERLRTKPNPQQKEADEEWARHLEIKGPLTR